MAKKVINEKAMNINNDKLEEIIEAFTQDRSKDTLIRLMTELRKCSVLVPGEFPKNLTEEQKGYIERREPFPAGKVPQILPLLVQNEEGKRYAPAISSRKHIKDQSVYPVMLTVKFQEVMRIASGNNPKLDGIMINPQTTKLILHPKFIETMKKMEAELASGRVPTGEAPAGNAPAGNVTPISQGRKAKPLSEPPTGMPPGAEGQPQTRQIKLSRDEFIVFARCTVEQSLLPKAVFADSAAFFEKLEEDGEGTIVSCYSQPFTGKIASPYSAEQFHVLLLDIDEATSFAAIDVPAPKNGLLCRAIYLVRNPQEDTVRYFSIETDEKEQGKEWLCEHTEGKRIVIGEAPETGTEMYTVLDLVENK